MTIKEIELTQDKITELMSQMPEEAREIFQAVLMKLSAHGPLNKVKDFLHNFSGDPVDSLIAIVLSKVIENVEGAIREDMKKTEEAGSDMYTGKLAAKIAIIQIRDIADNLENSIDCHNGCQCHVKH